MSENNLRISLNTEQTKKFLSFFVQEAIIIAKERELQKEGKCTLTPTK